MAQLSPESPRVLYSRHVLQPRGDATAGRGPDADLVRPSIARLRDDTATMLDMLTRRWPLVAEALLDGATPDQVAEATGLQLSDLRIGLTRWASIAVDTGQIEPAANVALMNVVFGPAG